jgi:heme-degrading monooxygenase HmoA
MFARVNIFVGQAADIEKRLSVLKDKIFSVMEKQKGFKNLYLLGDANKNKGYLVTFWDSEADLQAWLSSEEMAQAVIRVQEEMPAGSTPPPFEDYQVLYQA